MRSYVLFPAVLALAARALAVPIDDADALKLALKQVSNGVLSYYNESATDSIGEFPDPYYWWEAGSAWDSLINYWFLTGDSSHNALVQAALTAQSGERGDYLPLNQTKSEGNDDQATWALAAMTAAERNLPQPSDAEHAWIDMARNVFDEQVRRWDDASCGGGLRWQIFTFNAGYNYKGTLAQAPFIQLAARLARFTGNQTYVEWAEKAYAWTESIGLIDADTFAVYDGTMTTDNCTKFDRTQWSYNAASLTYSSSILANITNSPTWTTRTTSLLTALLPTFFPSPANILSEPACDPTATCDTNPDAQLYPALTLRWLALVPLHLAQTHDAIYTRLAASAAAAASRCDLVDGDDGEEEVARCRGNWANDTASSSSSVNRVDSWGLGQQLTALEALQAKLVLTADGVSSGLALAQANGSVASSGSEGGNGTATTTAAAGGASGTQTAASTNEAGLVMAASSWGVVVAAVGMVGAWLL